MIGELDEERLAAIERAIELDDPPHPARRARLLALKALELTWDPDFERRRALAEEAIALARDAGTRGRSRVLQRRHGDPCGPGDARAPTQRSPTSS